MSLKIIVLVYISTAFVLVQLCPDGQFETTFLDSCSDCPQNPETSCEGEGDDAESCKKSCIRVVITEEKSTGQINKLAIAIGVSCVAVSLVVIVCLGLYFHKKRNDGAVENDMQIEMQTILVGNENAEDDSPEPPPPSSSSAAATPAEFQIYTGEGTSSDLDIMKDRSSSALGLEELIV